MKQLSGQDASFIYTETANAPMHIATIYVYDQASAPGGLITFTGILEMLESRLHLAPVLRRRMVRVPMDVDHPYWIEDPDFDLEFHVRHIALPKPGDWRQLCIQAARLHSRPLDLNRPLWEINVIEGLDHVEGVPAGSFAFVMKIHHAAVDGASGIEMITALHDLIPGAHPPGPTQQWTPDPMPQPWELLARASVNQALKPFQFAEAMIRALPAARNLMPGTAPSIADQPTPPRTLFNAPVTTHRVVDGIAMPLAGVKQIRASLERATVNDAMLAVVAGGLRRYLLDKVALPAEPLVAMVPVSVRGADDKEAGNQVSAMLVSLHTHIAQSTDRFAAIRDSALAAKAALKTVGARNLTELAAFVPGAVVGAAARLNAELGSANQTTPAFNVVVTNVPGPQVPMYMMGAKLVSTYGMGPVFDGMGLMNAITSYCGEVFLSFTSCREILGDPAFYAQCLQESYDELLAGASPEARASTAKRSAKSSGAATAESRATRPSTAKVGAKPAGAKAGTAKRGRGGAAQR